MRGRRGGEGATHGRGGATGGGSATRGWGGTGAGRGETLCMRGPYQIDDRQNLYLWGANQIDDRQNLYLWGAYQIAVDGREPGCVRGIVDGPFSARLIRQVVSLFERDEQLGQCLLETPRLRQRLSARWREKECVREKERERERERERDRQTDREG